MRTLLPIGNGTLAASIFGQPALYHLVLNEKSLWSGGPGVPGYRHGNYPDDEVAWRHEHAPAKALSRRGV